MEKFFGCDFAARARYSVTDGRIATRALGVTLAGAGGGGGGLWWRQLHRWPCHHSELRLELMVCGRLLLLLLRVVQHSLNVFDAI